MVFKKCSLLVLSTSSYKKIKTRFDARETLRWKKRHSIVRPSAKLRLAWKVAFQLATAMRRVFAKACFSFAHA